MASTIFFILSKLGWGLIRPATWLMIGAALGFRAALKGRLRAARWWSGLTLAAMLLLATLPVGAWLLNPLEYRHGFNPPLEELDGMVILGFSNQPYVYARTGQVTLDGHAERLTQAAALARRFPEARVVYSGGSASLTDPNAVATRPDAYFKGIVLKDLGVAESRLTLEDRSRNTRENARFSKALIDPQPGETWALITSAYHMPRSYESFARAGWPEIIPYPVDFRTVTGEASLRFDLAGGLSMLELTMREYVGLIVYRLTAG